MAIIKEKKRYICDICGKDMIEQEPWLIHWSRFFTNGWIFKLKTYFNNNEELDICDTCLDKLRYLPTSFKIEEELGKLAAEIIYKDDIYTSSYIDGYLAGLTDATSVLPNRKLNNINVKE